MSSSNATRETHVVVRGSGHGFAQEISARSHRISADEPIVNETKEGRLDRVSTFLHQMSSMTIRRHDVLPKPQC
jgi:hypothetical protein